MSLLWHAHGRIEVERALLELSSARCHWKPFVVEAGNPDCLVRRVASLPEAERLPLEGSAAPWGYVQVEGNEVRAYIPENVFAAEAILRIAYQLLTIRAGGLMAHASAVSFGERAVAALGRSGAGKSTLAALGAMGGGGLILTDEVVQLYPGGTCAGTPFRSNQENVGAPGVFSLKSLLVLRQGSSELIERVSPHAVMPELWGQVFRAQAVPVPTGDAFSRLNAVMESSSVHRFTFRKHPEAGRFLREWVHAQ